MPRVAVGVVLGGGGGEGQEGVIGAAPVVVGRCGGREVGGWWVIDSVAPVVFGSCWGSEVGWLVGDWFRSRGHMLGDQMVVVRAPVVVGWSRADWIRLHQYIHTSM